MRPWLALLPVAFSAACAGLGDAAPEGAEDEDADLVAGQLSTRYRARFTDGEDDHDLYQVLSLQVGESDSPVTGSLQARALADIDGEPDEDDEFAFTSLADTQGDRVDVDLLHAYADFHEVDTLEVLRVGRQLLYETPELAWFDGVHLESVPKGSMTAKGGLYGGVPVHLYDDSSSGDNLFGAYGELRPWEGGRARFDWMHAEDDERFGGTSDDLFGLSFWQTAGDTLTFDGEYTAVDDDDRDVRVGGSWYSVEEDLFLRASHYRLLETQSELALELDPFTGTLQELFPYEQTTGLVSKGVGDRLRFELGFDARRVDDSDDVSPFNRDFDRRFLVAIFPELLPGDTTFSATIEEWSGAGNDVESWGVDLDRSFDEDWEASLGTYYSLFKYDFYSDAEREKVRTYYARVRHEYSESLRFDLRFDFEDDDEDSYQTLRWVTTWRF